CHGIAQHVHIAILLWQPLLKRLPFVAAAAATEHPQLSVGRKMLGVALDRHYVNSLRLVGVHVDYKAEISWQIAADLSPIIAGIVAAHYVPVFLHEEDIGSRRV